MFLVNDQADGQ